MQEVSRCCCGLDGHTDSIVVCVARTKGEGGKIIRKTYGSFRNELIRLRVWLKQPQVSEIAMESTGVYWRSVWNVFEDQGLRLLLVNPAQMFCITGLRFRGFCLNRDLLVCPQPIDS